MKKIFAEGEKFDRLTYSEAYLVSYTYTGKSGFLEQGFVTYFAASKGSHRQVQAKFRKEMAGKYNSIVSVDYQ